MLILLSPYDMWWNFRAHEGRANVHKMAFIFCLSLSPCSQRIKFRTQRAADFAAGSLEPFVEDGMGVLGTCRMLPYSG